MKSLISKIFAILCLATLYCCEGKVDTKGVAEELQRRKIERLTDADVFAMAENAGNETVKQASERIYSSLDSLLNAGQYEKAISYCNLLEFEKTDTVALRYGAKVSRKSNKMVNPKNQLSSREKEIFEAYQYNFENKIASTPNIQNLSGTELLYTTPIFIDQQYCLKCHGEPGKDVPQELYRQLKSKFPADSAFNYKLNDLRGMWSIILPKRKVVTGSARK